MQSSDKNTKNPSMHSIIKMQSFWHHRKLVCASDAFSASDAALANPIKSSNSISINISNSILISISFNISNQHSSSANIISAKITSARKHESDYISFSSILFILFFLSSSRFNHQSDEGGLQKAKKKRKTITMKNEARKYDENAENKNEISCNEG